MVLDEDAAPPVRIMTFRTLRDAGDVRGKRVLLREDLNVPHEGRGGRR